MSVVLAIFLLPLCAAADEYQWPLELPRQLTSSFAEYRPGRFHAGIDLRTGGIGLPVHAAADGYVSRVRCSPWGYGKAVYLQLKDGHSVVYGHLDDYDKRLRDYVRKAQHKAQDYTVDLYPAPGVFPVQRGQIIAASGQTGIGAPHLHYEIRDAAQHPINPRLLAVSWPDTTVPLIRRILVVPDGPGSSVNGDLVPITLDAQHTGENRYTCAAVRASGRIGFGIDVMDPGTGGYKLGIHRLRCMIGDTEVFRVQHDTLSYDNNRNAAVAYHPYFLDQGHFLVLWRWPGNACASYAVSAGDGWFAVPDQESEIRIEATDFLGNHAIVTFHLQPGDPSVDAPECPALGRGTAKLDCFGTYLVVTARFTAAEPACPELLIEGGNDLLAATFRRVDSKTFRAGFVPPRAGAYALRVSHPRMDPCEQSFHAFIRGEKGLAQGVDGLTLSAAPDSPYGILFVRTDTLAKPPPTPMKKVGNVYGIWPGDAPIDAPIQIAFPAPDTLPHPERIHVYRRQGSSWVREETQRTKGRFSIAARHFGTFAAMEDNSPPVISNVTPPNGYQAETRRPIIRAAAADAGSGIESFKMTCGGQWLLAAYDPERNRLEWERDEALPPGRHEIVIQVTDAAGNTATTTRAVVIPD